MKLHPQELRNRIVIFDPHTAHSLEDRKSILLSGLWKGAGFFLSLLLVFTVPKQRIV
jgi:hypothetical protein